jgi:hypothetical protein
MFLGWHAGRPGLGARRFLGSMHVRVRGGLRSGRDVGMDGGASAGRVREVVVEEAFEVVKCAVFGSLDRGR